MWKTFSLKQQGTSQRHHKCQDNVCIREDDRWIVATLADGLGSLSRSELASEVATNTICNLPSSQLERIIKSEAGIEIDIINAVSDAIKIAADSRNIDYSTCDCTLVFTVIDKLEDKAAVGNLGDSAVIILCSKTESIAISDSDYSANGTNTVLNSEASKRLYMKSFPIEENDIVGFILTSDGLDNELYRKGSRYVNKIAGLYFNAVSVSKNEEETKRIIQNRLAKVINNSDFDDDISIAILSRIDYPVKMPDDPTWLCSCGTRNFLQETYCRQCGKDFSILYQNIRFKEYGGKDAFFLRINKEPNEERRIVGLAPINNKTASQSADDNPLEGQLSDTFIAKTSSISSKKVSTTVNENPVKTISLGTNPSPQTVGSQQNDSKTSIPIQTKLSNNSSAKKTVNKKEKRSNKKPRFFKIITRLFPLMLCLIGGVALGVILKGVMSATRINNLNMQVKTLEDRVEVLSLELKKTEAYTKDAAAPTVTPTVVLTAIPTAIPTETPKPTNEPYVILEDKSYYWGPVTDGKANGYGMQLIGNKYYIGQFKMGIKSGEFTIVDLDNTNHVETVWYMNDNLIPTITPSSSTETNSSAISEYGTENLTQETALLTLEQVLSQSAFFREEPGVMGKIICELKTGTVVQLVDITAVNKDDYNWICVKLSDGTVGWIVKTALNIN